MKPSYEKLVPHSGESFRCFDRSVITSPVKWHRHPEIELTFLPCGSGSRIVGDHIGSYTAYDLVMCGSMLPHTWASDEYVGEKYDRHRAIVLQFHPDFLGPDLFACEEMSVVASLFQHAKRGLWFPSNIAIPIGQRMESLVTTKGAMRLIGLFTILHELSQFSDVTPLASELYSVNASVLESRHAESRIQKICDHISSHLADHELSHRELAELAEMNTSAFSRFFKQSTGRTPSTYINELRIGRACRFLSDTDESILAICYQSGFANLSNFNRRFRQLREMTPSEYRARFRVAT